MKKVLLAVFYLALTFQGCSQLQKKDIFFQEWEKMHESKEQALKNFIENKFGMFITWGAYSLPVGVWKGEKIRGLGEWIMYNDKISREE